MVWHRWVFAERCRLIPGRLGERIEMKAQTQTIEQLTRVLDVDERKVSRTARRVLGLSTAMVRDPGLGLSRNHCRQIAQAVGRPDPWGPGVETLRAVEPEGGATGRSSRFSDRRTWSTAAPRCCATWNSAPPRSGG